jgi:AraC-like DNA-binding protein
MPGTMVRTKVPVRRKWLFSLVRDVQVMSSVLLDELKPVTLVKLESALTSLHPPSSRLEELLVKGFAAEVLAHSTVLLGRFDPSDPTGHAGVSDKVAQAKGLIDADCAGPWDLNRLSRAVQWNRTTLANAFRSEVGMSIHRYLMSRRIALARDRLARTDDKIVAIAMDVGYSHAAFQRTFRRLTGMSPSAYRIFMQRRRRSATK